MGPFAFVPPSQQIFNDLKPLIKTIKESSLSFDLIRYSTCQMLICNLFSDKLKKTGVLNAGFQLVFLAISILAIKGYPFFWYCCFFTKMPFRFLCLIKHTKLLTNSEILYYWSSERRGEKKNRIDLGFWIICNSWVIYHLKWLIFKRGFLSNQLTNKLVSIVT